jgi:hypothetical protein
VKPIVADFRTRHPPPRSLWLMLGLLGAVAGVALVGALLQRNEVGRLERELAALSMPRAPVALAQPKAPPYQASAEEMLREASSQWPAALTALETIRVSGIRVIAVDIAPAETQMQVEVQFEEYGALLKYVENLNAGEPSRRWTLLKAQSGGKNEKAPSTASIRCNLRN